MQAIYLYGIVPFPPRLAQAIPGLGSSPVYLLADRTLAAVVSRSPLLCAWPVDEYHLSVHEMVVEQVMVSRPIAPARFNTIFKTRTSVLSLLHAQAQTFSAVLERVAGKVELGLRVLWDPPPQDDGPVRLNLGLGGPGSTYLARQLRQERRRTRLREVGEQLIGELDAVLGSAAAERRLQRLPTDRLLLSGAYLVERDRTTAFRERVASAEQDYPGLRFLVTGPWPPYHFVSGDENGTEDALRV